MVRGGARTELDSSEGEDQGGGDMEGEGKTKCHKFERCHLQSICGESQAEGEYPVRPIDPQKVCVMFQSEGEERQYMVMTISAVDLARFESVHNVCCLWTERGVRIVQRVFHMLEFMKMEGVEGILHG